MEFRRPALPNLLSFLPPNEAAVATLTLKHTFSIVAPDKVEISFIGGDVNVEGGAGGILSLVPQIHLPELPENMRSSKGEPYFHTHVPDRPGPCSLQSLLLQQSLALQSLQLTTPSSTFLQRVQDLQEPPSFHSATLVEPPTEMYHLNLTHAVLTLTMVETWSCPRKSFLAGQVQLSCLSGQVCAITCDGECVVNIDV